MLRAVPAAGVLYQEELMTWNTVLPVISLLLGAGLGFLAEFFRERVAHGVL
jgi:hypothetical protein